jgi:hypothetical protein
MFGNIRLHTRILVPGDYPQLHHVYLSLYLSLLPHHRKRATSATVYFTIAPKQNAFLNPSPDVNARAESARFKPPNFRQDHDLLSWSSIRALVPLCNRSSRIDLTRIHLASDRVRLGHVSPCSDLILVVQMYPCLAARAFAQTPSSSSLAQRHT